MQDPRLYHRFSGREPWMRTLCLLAVACGLSVSPAAAFGNSVVDRNEFVQEFTGPVRYCDFPLTTSFRAEHRTSLHYVGLPDGWTADTPGSLAYNVSAQHFIDNRETVTNPANGLSIDLHITTRVRIRDVDTSGLTFDSEGRATGEMRATHYVSRSITGTAPGEGVLLLRAGHTRTYVTTFSVNDRRVGRQDSLFFVAGPVFPFSEVCSYLAST